MKFTLSWLKDHLDTKATVDEIVAFCFEVSAWMLSNRRQRIHARGRPKARPF